MRHAIATIRAIDMNVQRIATRTYNQIGIAAADSDNVDPTMLYSPVAAADEYGMNVLKACRWQSASAFREVLEVESSCNFTSSTTSMYKLV